MKSLYLAAALSLAALPTWAQQPAPDPSDLFIKEWGTMQAADTLSAASHEHLSELAQRLIVEFRRQRIELEGVKKRGSDLDSYLKACGDKPGCTVPVPE